MHVHLYQIVQRDTSKSVEESKEIDFQGQFQGILNQFSFLKNFNEKSTSNSLVQEVFNEAIAADTHPKSQNTHF